MNLSYARAIMSVLFLVRLQNGFSFATFIHKLGANCYYQVSVSSDQEASNKSSWSDFEFAILANRSRTTRRR